MSFDVISYALNKKYTDESIAGISGALAGKNCTISDVSKVGLITTITFQWTADDGTTRTTDVQVSDGETPTMDVTPITNGNRITFTTTDDSITFDVINGEDGVSVVNAQIDEYNHLIITLSDSNEIDCGEIAVDNELSELDDVALTTPSDGDSLVYDAESDKWVNKELSYEYSLEDLTDIDIDVSELSDGDIIKWDESSSKWVKGSIPTIKSLDDIGDVNLTTPSIGQILTFDGTNWINEDNEVVADLTDLGDVTIQSPTNGQILKYDSLSGKWYNGDAGAVSTTIEDLADVNVDSVTIADGQVLVYDAEHEVWVNADSSGSIETLGDIGDVDLTNIQNGQVIIYDAANSKWINAEIATNLSELSDVDLGTLAGLDMLRYNLLTSKWENFAADTTVTESSTNIITGGAVYTAIDAVLDKLGDLASLDTTVKTDVVSAINEVVSDIGNLHYLEQFGTMPSASDKHNAIVQYIGADSVDYKRGYIYHSTPSVEHGEVVYNWVRVDVQPSNNDYESLMNKPQINSIELVGNKSLDDLTIQGKLQYDTLPTPSNALVGKIVEYTGASTASLITGYFYQCQYVAANNDYEWINIDVSSNSTLASRISTLETNQGDMTQLEVSGVSDIVSALNKLNVRGIKSITYVEPYLIITLMDNTTFQFDLTVVLQSTDIGELANVLDTNIQNGNLLQYDTSISKYKPYDVVGAMSTLLQDAKDYTDQEISSAVQEDAYICDAKPSCTYDSSSSKYIVVYYQNSVAKTTTAISSRFYYKDLNQDPYCTSWFETGDPNVDPVEFTYLISTPDFDDYVNKNTDIVSTYTTDMPDKTKVPNISSMDALYTLVSTALGLKVNTSDIVDALTSDDATVPLSAAQGKVLKGLIDKKQDIMQVDALPVASATEEDNIYQYVGATSGAYVNGRFYKCVETETDVYAWQEVKFSADYDATIIQGSTNAPQGGAVYTALADKQNVTLTTPIVVEGTSTTTVEGALGTLNTAKAKVFQVTSMASPSEDIEGLVVQYVGDTTVSYTEGYFYKCKEVLPSTDPKVYEWVALTSKIDVDNTLSNTSTNPVQNNTITNAVQALQAGVTITYADEASLPDEVDYAGGVILTVGTIGYCLAEKTYWKVTAINSSSLAITWTAYDPHIASDDVATTSTTGLVSADGTTIDVDLNGELSINSSQRIFIGTNQDWINLTTAQKAMYTLVNITDDDGSTIFTPISVGGVNYYSVEAAVRAMATIINNSIYWN